MENVQTEIAEMISNPSWQDERSIPIISNDEFNTFLRNHLKDSTLSDLQCKQMKKQLVNSGFLLDFRKLVVLKPQWLADTFKSVISTKYENDNGILSLNQVVDRLGLNEEICKKLIWIWEKELNTFVSHPKLENKFIIPSLLPEKRPKDLENEWKGSMNKRDCIGRVYTVPFIPIGVFEGIFVRCSGISPMIGFWRNGFLLCKDEGSFLHLEMVTNNNSHIHSSKYIVTIHATG